MARRLGILMTLLLLTAGLAVTPLASAVSAESKVTVGSPATPYLPNGSNEPALAMDAHSPAVLAAGANDLVDNSPCNPNFHVRTDLNDFHYYRSLPERRAEWDKLTEEFASRPAWTFSPHGDAVTTGKEPLIQSEFGVWGLPRPQAQRRR